MEKNIAIIFAGGVGSRMGIKDVPKQFLEIFDIPIIIYTLKIFENNKNIDEIYIGCLESWIPYLKKLLKEFNIKKVKSIIPGGKTGQDTIYLTLKEARKHNDGNSIVLIHDGVRPYITDEVIKNNIESVKKYGNAISVTPTNETILISKDGTSVQDVPIRKEMFVGQAPQSFRLDDVLSAHEEIRKINREYKNVSDTCTLYHMLGRKVHMVNGNKGNLKVTDEIDYYIIKAILDYSMSTSEMLIPLNSIQERMEKYEFNIKE